MDKTNEMVLRFLSRSSNESFARVTVAAFVAQNDPTLEEITDIKTAISEAVTNSIIHGYEDGLGYVEIKAVLYPRKLIAWVSDQGKGIETLKKPGSPYIRLSLN